MMVLILVSCLCLFASLNFQDEAISSEYYLGKIDNLICKLEHSILVPNSKIFSIINQDSIKEFLNTSKKNNIFKSDDQINKFYLEKNYEIIIDQLEDFAENHKLVSIILNYIFLIKNYISFCLSL
jgi:hypothetical protein